MIIMTTTRMKMRTLRMTRTATPMITRRMRAP